MLAYCVDKFVLQVNSMLKILITITHCIIVIIVNIKYTTKKQHEILAIFL